MNNCNNDISDNNVNGSNPLSVLLSKTCAEGCGALTITVVIAEVIKK